ncbi:hypothetical protein JKP88DRAFT_347924 [Tribonema minus]|uniref:Uncharacterized protein n=1 Tax=Tribonema minus TaxID=303371 RepID=A0A835Z7M5_9STRA|nr:hypothetical protein JKP88DRAFT_347924 [Tribonema minus]
MGGDDGFSASELRQRYSRGGTAKDSELSAAQLRARYGIANKPDVGMDKKGGANSSGQSSIATMVILVCILAAAGVAAAVFLQ